MCNIYSGRKGQREWDKDIEDNTAKNFPNFIKKLIHISKKLQAVNIQIKP